MVWCRDCIAYLLWCNKLPPNLMTLNISYFTVSVDWESECDLAESFLLRISWSCRCQVGYSPLDCAGGFTSNMAHSHAWQLSWLLTRGFSSSPNGHFHRTPWVSLWCGSWICPERMIQEKQGRSCNVFCDLASEVTRHHFCNFLLFMQTSPVLW